MSLSIEQYNGEWLVVDSKWGVVAEFGTEKDAKQWASEDAEEYLAYIEEINSK